MFVEKCTLYHWSDIIPVQVATNRHILMVKRMGGIVDVFWKD